MHEVSRSRIVKSVCSILHSGSHSIFPYRFGIDETDDDEQVVHHRYFKNPRARIRREVMDPTIHA